MTEGIFGQVGFDKSMKLLYERRLRTRIHYFCLFVVVCLFLLGCFFFFFSFSFLSLSSVERSTLRWKRTKVEKNKDETSLPTR